jgi:hypothetical protein
VNLPLIAPVLPTAWFNKTVCVVGQLQILLLHLEILLR